MTTRNNKGRDSGKSATPKKTTKKDSKQKPARLQDMSSAAQRKRVLEYLRASPQTTYSLRAHGISHPAQRVRELIVMDGYLIDSSPVTAIDSDGFMHRGVALYSLYGEPATRDLFEDLEVAHV
ncbi:helix-turn-helix domain-containing protein [Caballeronia sp. LjRoot34]|uniref:helix-turn-helix domain-containing protein n=1 Tax=Caballeronia sp. LjRoot34 TaxID=3342325 RepID=UPI003ED135A6